MDKRSISADHLRRAIGTVLTDTAYRQKAVEIGSSFQEAGGCRAAADEVEQFAISLGS